MNLTKQPVTLRGYLDRDVEVSGEPYVVLALIIESAMWDEPTSLCIARTTQVPVVCSPLDDSGTYSHLKESDYIEVEGELCLCEEDGPVIWSRTPRVMRVAGIKVRATHVRELDTPAANAAN